MKKYGITITFHSGNTMYYAGVTANTHIEAKEKVEQDRWIKGDFLDIRSIKSEILKDWNDIKDVLNHWNAEDL